MFSPFLFDLNLFTLWATAVSLVGLAIWFLKRKKHLRLWMPITRIFNFSMKKLPKLLFTTPPWVPFLCFLLAVLSLVMLSLKPTVIKQIPTEGRHKHTHLFLDFSPSVSAHLTVDEMVDRAVQIYKGIGKEERFTVSTSNSADIFEPRTRDELVSQLKFLKFHRPGLKIASAVADLLKKLGALDRLFIMSDGDLYSWDGFNWKNLEGEMDLYFIDISDESVWSGTNVFINSVNRISESSGQNSEFEVEIERRGKKGEVNGDLLSVYHGVAIKTVPFVIPETANKISLRVSWPVSLLDEVPENAPGQVLGGEPGLDKYLKGKNQLVWKLTMKNQDKDVLKMDDEFVTESSGEKKRVLIVGGPFSEGLIDNPVYQIQTTLEVLGFGVERLDYLEGQKSIIGTDDRYLLSIIIGGAGRGVENYCPMVGELPPSGNMETSGSAAKIRRIWLAPYDLAADYQEICFCYQKMVSDQVPCQDVIDRKHWLALLPKIGAKQIGGQLGEEGGSVAWLRRDEQRSLEVVSFSVPLRPLLETGLTYATFPVLVRELLKWQGIVPSSESPGNNSILANKNEEKWPRLSDITDTLWETRGSLTDEEYEKYQYSNIPMGESLLLRADKKDLPTEFIPAVDLAKGGLISQKKDEDPLPWIITCIGVLIFSLGLEFFWSIGKLIFRRYTATLMLLFFILVFSGQDALAKVTINLLGYGAGGQVMTFNKLAREVSYRTSIDLNEKPYFVKQSEENDLLDPWLFVRDISFVSTSSGHLKPQYVQWLKKGGFLVIEGNVGELRLKNLTGVSQLESGAEWMPIPPDHELMRSFYLLDSLPSCQTEIWRGLHFDKRLGILVIPFPFLETIQDSPISLNCSKVIDAEWAMRSFINLLMVVLATDYKKDQIHLPEILKRLR